VPGAFVVTSTLGSIGALAPVGASPTFVFSLTASASVNGPGTVSASFSTDAEVYGLVVPASGQSVMTCPSPLAVSDVRNCTLRPIFNNAFVFTEISQLSPITSAPLGYMSTFRVISVSNPTTTFGNDFVFSVRAVGSELVTVTDAIADSAQILVTDTPTAASTITCNNTVPFVGQAVSCTIVPKNLTGATIYSPSSAFTLAGTGFTFSSLVPSGNAKSFSFTFGVPNLLGVNNITTGVAGLLIQVSVQDPCSDATLCPGVKQPAVQATIRIVATFPVSDAAQTAFKNSFISDVSAATGIAPSRIVVNSLTSGSVIVTFTVLPPNNPVSEPPASAVVQNIAQQVADPASPLRTQGTVTNTVDPAAGVTSENIVFEFCSYSGTWVATGTCFPPPPKSSDSFPAWAIAVIVVVGSLAIGAAAFAVYWFKFRSPKQTSTAPVELPEVGGSAAASTVPADADRLLRLVAKQASPETGLPETSSSANVTPGTTEGPPA